MPAAWYLRVTAKRGEASEDLTLSKKVSAGVGETVLILLKARPSRPSLLVFCWNVLETEVAASTA